MRSAQIGVAACISLIGLAVAGCSASMPDAAAAVQSASDSYFVMGVQPHNAMPLIDDGVHTLPLHEYGQSQGDYVVAKVAPSSSNLMIREVALMAGHSIFGVRLIPCTVPLSFPVPGGKVIYVTNVTISSAGTYGRFNISHYQDLQGARDFVAAHYPQLAGKVEQGVVNFPPPNACR
jgi:hypothetical protein